MRIIQMLLLVMLVHSGIAQEFTPVDSESKINFKIKNLGINVNGSLKGLTGKIMFDSTSPAKSTFDVTVDAATIDTDNKTRDGHLKKEEYFDVQNFPSIHFVSTSVSKTGAGGSYTVTGKLTIKNTTKEITIPFTAQSVQEGYLFKGDFKLNRRDFGVGGGSTLSDELTVSLEVTAKKS